MTALRNLLIAIVVLITFACNSPSSQYNQYPSEYVSAPTYIFPGMDWLPMVGSDGKTYSHIPLPKGWQLNHHRRTTNDPFFTYGENAYVTIGVSSIHTGRDATVDQFYRKNILPISTQSGGRFINSFPIPSIDRYHDLSNDKLYSISLNKKRFETKGFEILYPDGSRGLSILSLGVERFTRRWMTISYTLVSTDHVYEASKKAIIFGISNQNDNDQQIMAYNAEEKR